MDTKTESKHVIRQSNNAACPAKLLISNAVVLSKSVFMSYITSYAPTSSQPRLVDVVRVWYGLLAASLEMPLSLSAARKPTRQKSHSERIEYEISPDDKRPHQALQYVATNAVSPGTHQEKPATPAGRLMLQQGDSEPSETTSPLPLHIPPRHLLQRHHPNPARMPRRAERLEA